MSCISRKENKREEWRGVKKGKRRDLYNKRFKKL